MITLTRKIWLILLFVSIQLFSITITDAAKAAVTLPFNVNLSENVVVTGTPRIAVDVGGATRYATYSSGSGTNTLTFSLAPNMDDVDMDGITISSPIDLNGGTIKDATGNTANLTFSLPNTSGIKINYPSLSMDLIYDSDGRYTINGTVYNDLASFLSAIGGSFSRGSIGTYFDSTGTLQTATSGTTRFDYDPTTHTPLGILIEESRTNLHIHSSEMENSVWTSTGMTTLVNNLTAPDSTLTAEKATPTVGSGQHRFYESATGKPSVTAGQTYTASIFAKTAGQQYLDLYLGYSNFPSNNGATFDLVNGTIVRTFTSTTPKIQSIGNGWYRCSITVQASTSGSANSAFFVVHSVNSGTPNVSTTGDGTSGYYFWGAQYEQGSFMTSYIPTSTTTVTRAADNLTLGTSTILNQSAWSATAQTFGIPTNQAASFLGFSNAIGFGALNGSSSSYKAWSTDGSTSLGTTVPTPYYSATAKSSIGVDASGRSITANGLSPSSDAVNITSSSAWGAIGSAQNTLYLNAYLQKLNLYGKKLPDAQLQLLTQ